MTSQNQALPPQDWCRELARRLVELMSEKVSEFEAIQHSIADMQRTCGTAGHHALEKQLEILAQVLALASPTLVPGVRLLARSTTAVEAAEQDDDNPDSEGAP